jgi:F-type H+-transporting ATPase subunit epsilon
MSLTEKTPTFDCQLIAPDRIVFSGLVEMVIVPAAKGALGILPTHAPIVTTLQPGVVDIYQGQEITNRIFINGGYTSVTETKCIILSDEAVLVTDIQPGEVEAYIERTQAELAKQSLAPDEKTTLEQDLMIARAKMELFRQLTRH